MKRILLGTVEENSQHLLLDDGTPSWESSSGGKVSKGTSPEMFQGKRQMQAQERSETGSGRFTRTSESKTRRKREALQGKVKTQRIKISLTKAVKEWYSENCKTLLKEIEGNTNRRKDSPCS